MNRRYNLIAFILEMATNYKLLRSAYNRGFMKQYTHKNKSYLT